MTKKFNIEEEFRRQLENLIYKDYHNFLGLNESKFRELFQPLKEKLPLRVKGPDFENGYLPFVIVVKSKLISAEKMMTAVRFNGKEGITKLYPHTAEDFKVIDDMGIPEGSVYLILDVERGKETINITPEHAFGIIKSRKRFPLTVDEGIAILTHFPEFLMKNKCFSLLSSRTGNDQRVPAIWINAKKEANLGWCWERNPHTWLGSASCKLRA